MEDERVITPDEICRRLMKGTQIVYPYTKQQLVMGLQRTIRDKLPIKSATEPENVVPRQIWLDISNQEEGPISQLEFEEGVEQANVDFQILEPARADQLEFEDSPVNNVLAFGESSNNEHLVFEREE